MELFLVFVHYFIFSLSLYYTLQRCRSAVQRKKNKIPIQVHLVSIVNPVSLVYVCFQDNHILPISRSFLEKYPTCYISQIIKDENSYDPQIDAYFFDSPRESFDVIVDLLMSNGKNRDKYSKDDLAKAVINSQFFFPRVPKVLLELKESLIPSVLSFIHSLELDLFGIEDDGIDYKDNEKKITKDSELKNYKLFCLELHGTESTHIVL